MFLNPLMQNPLFYVVGKAVQVCFECNGARSFMRCVVRIGHLPVGARAGDLCAEEAGKVSINGKLTRDEITVMMDSPVCWVHAVLIMVFLYQLDFPLDTLGVKLDLGIEDRQAMALGGLVPLITGVLVGSLLRSPTKPKTA